MHITTLSNTTKMRCKSWGIPTKYCITGSKLAKQEGTSCGLCYAKTGNFRFEPVQNVLENNFKAYNENHKRWIDIMVYKIEEANQHYFRWFHAGDLQSLQMLEDMATIAVKLPDVKFWLPTQERKMVWDYLQKNGDFPKNLCVRISSPLLDLQVTTDKRGVPNSMVSTTLDIPKNAFSCVAEHQEGSCGTCRQCWKRETVTVSYPLHIAGRYRPKGYTRE